MKKATNSIAVFGGYLGLLGTMLVVAPNLLLAVFGIPVTQEVWIRILGIVVLTLSFYYLQAACHEVIPFFRWTVWTRTFFFVSLTVFVVLGFAPPVLILFGALDAIGAFWTARALQPSSGSVSLPGAGAKG